MNHRQPCLLLGRSFKKSWQITSRARRFTAGPSKDLPDFDSAPSFRLTTPPNPNWVPCQGASRDTELDKAWAYDLHGVKTWNPVLMPSRYEAFPGPRGLLQLPSIKFNLVFVHVELTLPFHTGVYTHC